jgi:hypothetical protein
LFLQLMAAPSLQDVLAAVPAVAELVNQMTELLPGVPASEQNLQTLWSHLQNAEFTDIHHPDGYLVVLVLDSKRKGVYQTMHVQVRGRVVDCCRRHSSVIFFDRPLMCQETHKNTGEGLLQCLLFARQSLKRFRAEGACPGCCSAALAGIPVRMLKAVGMPRCAGCMLTAVISAPPSKRAKSIRE